jgi:hypothetical protein
MNNARGFRNFLVNELSSTRCSIVNFRITMLYNDALMYSQDMVVLFVIVALTLKRQFDFTFVFRYFKKSDFVNIFFLSLYLTLDISRNQISFISTFLQTKGRIL